jgi:hypothetical protein
MATAQAFISLDSVVNDYINESDSSIHNYSKCYHLAYRCMEMLGLDFFYNIRTVKLAILSNKTVPIPSDCIKYTKIGVLNGKGEIVDLKYNGKMTTFDDLSPNRQQNTIDNTIFSTIYNPTSPVFFNYWYDGAFTNIYGVPSGGVNIGSFKVDEANGVILLNEDYAFDYVMLEYIASPAQNGNDYQVPLFFREAIIAFLWWKDKKTINTKRGAVGIQRDLKSDFYNERRLANARYRPLYLNEAYQISLDATRLTVKV